MSTTNRIAAALMAARQEFGRAAKDGKNTHLQNKYPTLAAIIDACSEPLERHGLTWWQPIVVSELGPVLRTVLCHAESGETLTCDVPLLYEGNNSKLNPMQAMGSAITYARRYGLESLLGLQRDDDDGNGAFPPRREQHRPAAPVQVPGLRPMADDPVTFDRWCRSVAKKLGMDPADLRGECVAMAVREKWTTPAIADADVPDMLQTTFETHRQHYTNLARGIADRKAVPA